MKQLRKLQPSDPALLLNTATDVPREAATTENLLVGNLPVAHPVNTLTPHFISEQVRAHLFLHYWQMFTKGRQKTTRVSPVVDLIKSASENTRTSPKKPGGLKRCAAGKETPRRSASHLSAPVTVDHVVEYLLATYGYLTCWKVMWREERALNAFTHLQLLGKTFLEIHMFNISISLWVWPSERKIYSLASGMKKQREKSLLTH